MSIPEEQLLYQKHLKGILLLFIIVLGSSGIRFQEKISVSFPSNPCLWTIRELVQQLELYTICVTTVTEHNPSIQSHNTDTEIVFSKFKWGSYNFRIMHR